LSATILASILFKDTGRLAEWRIFAREKEDVDANAVEALGYGLIKGYPSGKGRAGHGTRATGAPEMKLR
jgi:hypothetical protein